MPNNSLHEKSKEALKKHLKSILCACTVNNGIVNFIVDFDDITNEELYKYTTEAQKHRKIWMRDIDQYILLYKNISNYLSEHVKEWRKDSGVLKDIIGDKGIESLSNRIILYLESIPRDYFVYFELPALQGLGVKEIKLTDDISLIEKVNEDDFSEVRIPADGLSGKNYPLRKGQLYIRILVKGYADKTLESSAIRKAYSRFKQLILLAKLAGVLVERSVLMKKEETPFGLLLGYSVPPKMFVNYSKEPETENYLVAIPKTVSDHVSKFKINEDKLKPDELEVRFETFENKDVLTSNDKAKLLKKRLQYPIKLLQTSEEDESSEPIKTAIEWAFDSLTNDNDTFAFIQACIGLEAIVGEEDPQEKLTNTLADRCAYLLGSSIPKRKKVKENFKKLYDIRSKLVHGRKASLGDEERHFLRFTQGMLSQIIWKEISYIEESQA